MRKRDLVKYSKFYVRLEELEKQIRDLVDLGIHLKTANLDLLSQLNTTANRISRYFDEEENSGE